MHTCPINYFHQVLQQQQCEQTFFNNSYNYCHLLTTQITLESIQCYQLAEVPLLPCTSCITDSYLYIEVNHVKHVVGRLLLVKSCHIKKLCIIAYYYLLCTFFLNYAIFYNSSDSCCAVFAIVFSYDYWLSSHNFNSGISILQQR